MKADKKYGAFLGRAAALGAGKAKIISASSVVTADWVRLKCQYGCGMFGAKLTCPPRSPGPGETKRTLAGYKYGIMIRADTCRDIRRIVPVLEREIFLGGFRKAFAMGAGPCGLCRECAVTCRHPEQVRPAMEACGIDVFATAKNNGFRLEVLRTKASRADCYGLVLIE